MGDWNIVQADVMRWAEEYDGPPFHACLCDPPYSLHFMNRAWDDDIAFRPETWAALSQHLLPGAWLMAFGSTRGWHRLACAIEDAGMIIQPSVFVEGVGVVDCSPMVLHLSGQSFPKASRIDTRIDKRKGYKPGFAKEVVTYLREARDSKGLTNKQIDAAFGFNGMAGHWCGFSQPEIPRLEYWPKLKEMLGLDDRFDEAIEAHEREVMGKGIAGLGKGRPAHDGGFKADYWETAPATPLARAWEGHRYGGQVLRDVACPIVCAQKPWGRNRLDDIVQYGSGSLWVDGGRVATGEALAAHHGTGDGMAMQGNVNPNGWGQPYQSGDSGKLVQNKGRWPPNYACTHFAMELPDGTIWGCERVTVPAPCPSCNGNGCPDCGGSGSVERGAVQRVKGHTGYPHGRKGEGSSFMSREAQAQAGYRPDGPENYANREADALRPVQGRADEEGFEHVNRYRCARHCAEPAVSADEASEAEPCGGAVCDVCGGTGTVEVGATNKVATGTAVRRNIGHSTKANIPYAQGSKDAEMKEDVTYADEDGKESVSRYLCARCCGTGCGAWWLAETPTPCPECGGEGEWGCQVRKLDESVGSLQATKRTRRKDSPPKGWSGGDWYNPAGEDFGYAGSGGPSRYYPSPDFSHETSEALALGAVRCAVCLTKIPKQVIMSETQEGVSQWNEENVYGVGDYSPLSEKSSCFAQIPARQQEQLDEEGTRECGNTPVLNATSASTTTQATIENTAHLNVLLNQTEKNALAAKSAANLCERCAIAIAQSLVLIKQGHDQELPVGQVSITEQRRQILIQSLVNFAKSQDKLDIILTIATLKTLFGFVTRVMEDFTPIAPLQSIASETSKKLALGPVRKYQAKPSRAERDAGLEGIPEEAHGSAFGNDGARPHTRADYEYQGKRRNPHPTVKSIALTKWLATLLLPPAIYAPRRLLVPFAGTGSEAIGALLAGWEYVTMVEMDESYCEMAEARCKFWQGWSEGTGITNPKAILKAARKAEGQAAKDEAENDGQLSLDLPTIE